MPAMITAPGERNGRLNEFDANNHWLVDRGDGEPSVNLVVLSFVNPLKLFNKPTDATTAGRCTQRDDK